MRVRNVPFIILAILAALSGSAAAGAAAEVLPSGGILEAGQIDSSTVEPGASVAVVYGLGYRDPVSGEWPRLTTARGTVHAVDGQRLLLALEGRDSLQRIDLERIQTLVLAGSPSPKGLKRARVLRPDGLPAGENPQSSKEQSDSAQVDVGRVMGELGETPDSLSERTAIINSKTGQRIVRKLSTGALVGTFSAWSAWGLATFLVGNEETVVGAGVSRVAIFGTLTGYAAGTAVGVTLVDPHDHSVRTLFGSLVGLAVGIMTARSTSEWSIVVCPVALATSMSELWRDPPEGFRFTTDPRPSRRGLQIGRNVVF